MALPTTGYDTATVTNPSSALTDFSLLIDLSRMSSSWWAAVNTSDGTKGRAAKNDGTELATDWIDFDDTAETGFLRVKWSSTLAASGTQVIRVYPPVAANSSNAASATYGSDNTYDSDWWGYWPFQGDANDRTSNGRALSSVGTPTLGSTGKFGEAVDFDSGDGYASDDDFPAITTTDDVSIMAWMKPDGVSVFTQLFGVMDGSNYFHLRADSADGYSWISESGAGHTGGPDIGSMFGAGTWVHAALFKDQNEQSLAKDGTTDPYKSAGSREPAAAPIEIGATVHGSFTDWAGLAQDLQVHTALRDGAWNEQEYDQANDQATFWGTWAWTAGSGGGTANNWYHQANQAVVA